MEKFKNSWELFQFLCVLEWILARDKENREMRRKVESRNPWLFFYLVIYLVVPNIGVAWRNPFASSLCSPYLWSWPVFLIFLPIFPHHCQSVCVIFVVELVETTNIGHKDWQWCGNMGRKMRNTGQEPFQHK